MAASIQTQPRFFYPPGGIMIWILIVVELLTFGIAMIALAVSSKENPELFHQSRLHLNTYIGTLNTIFLLASGFFMAVAVQETKNNNHKLTAKYILLALSGGGLFLILKSLEYYVKIEQGLTVGHNTFFTYYWLLTLFHLIHVLVGMGILTGLYFSVRKGITPERKENIGAGAAFWHMCDIIWLFLFPVLYLIL